MDWKFDIDTRALTRKQDDLFVRSVRLSFPDTYPVRVEFVRGSEPYVFTGHFTVILKPLSQPDAAPLAGGVQEVTNTSVAQAVLSLATFPVETFVKKFGDRPATLEIAAFHGDLQIASWSVFAEVNRRSTPLVGATPGAGLEDIPSATQAISEILADLGIEVV